MIRAPVCLGDGMTSISELDTPALLVDLDALEHNASLMVQRCTDSGIAWRPHVKACKAPAMALRLMAAGAVGVTCAKASEAAAMAEGGVSDILIANEVVGAQKVARLIEVARLAKIAVAVDNADNLREIAAAADAADVTVDILVDIDVNLHRCGVEPSVAPRLCALVEDLPGVRLRGLMGYEGHVMGLPPDEKQRETAISAAILSEAQDLCEANGHEIGVLSGGGSGNYRYVLEQRALTELQAGGAALMDVTYEQMGVAGHRRALSLICQVVSSNATGRAAGDAGWKATGRHTGLPLVVEPAGVRCVGLSAEHTHFAIEDGQQVRVGDRVRMIPHYSDSTVLLHRNLYAVRGDEVEEVWEITGSGALQ